MSFDVLLSHNSVDKPVVRQVGVSLKSRGLSVWLDEWELVPGRPWQEALEEIVKTTKAVAVLVGSDGVGPWQDQEMRGCLSEFVDRGLPVIPVLLPDAPEKPELPMFLKQFTWVDLRPGLTDEALDRIQWGITGVNPNPPVGPSQQAAPPGRGGSATPAGVQQGRRASIDRRIQYLGIGLSALVLLPAGYLIWLSLLRDEMSTENIGQATRNARPLGELDSALAESDPDRAVAIWVVELGGAVSINFDWETLATAAEVNEASRFKLVGIDFEGVPVSDADLLTLGAVDLPDLEDLSIAESRVSDGGIGHLGRFTKLSALDLKGLPRVTNESLVTISKLARLQDLILTATGITDDGLKHLQGLKYLRDVHLDEIEGVTATGVAALKKSLPTACEIQF